MTPTRSASARRAGNQGIRRARKLIRLAGDAQFRRGLRHGVAAATEHETVAFEHDFASVIDVGAHTGQFALFATRRFPRARVFCFEPLPRARQKLQQVLDGHPGLTVFDAAAGAEAGTVPLHVAGRDDSSSLLPLTDRCTEAFPGTAESHSIEVRAVRLDESLAASDIQRPALLKIDVQGYELEVLRGSDRLFDCIDEILVEASFVELYQGQPLAAEVIGFLHEQGFALTGVFGQTRDRTGGCLQADFLFRSTRASVMAGPHQGTP